MNAVLNSNDITALIRDTEIHERAIFTLREPPAATKSRDLPGGAGRRTTTFDLQGGVGANNVNFPRGPRKNTAVAAVLGGELAERIRAEASGLGGPGRDRERGDVDVNVLLSGAEKLCAVL